MAVLVPTAGIPNAAMRAMAREAGLSTSDYRAAFMADLRGLRGADPFAGTVAARDASVAWMTFMGIPQGTDGIDQYDRLADFASAPADMSWVYACVSRVARAAMKVPLRVYVKKGKDRVNWEDEPTPAAEDLQYLLDWVNPVDMTGAEMRAYIRASAKVWGGWYLKRARGRLLHDTQELYWLRVPDVKPASADGRSVDTYQYAPQRAGSIGNTWSAVTEDINPKDMIRQRGLNLRSQVEMESPLSAARYDMVTDQAASQRTAAILRRRGVPEGYWKAAKGAELEPADKTAIRRYLRSLVGPRNAGKTLVAPDIEFQAIELPEKDAQWLEGRKVSRMTVSAVIGVPLVLAGDDEKASVYASIRDAQRVFWQDTMTPDLDGDADTFNNWLVPEFNRPGDPVLEVGFDYSGVEPLKPLWKDEWDGYLSAVDHQAITPNTFNRHFGLPDVPWGDKPVPRTQIALRPSDVTTEELALAVPALAGAESLPAAEQEPQDSPDQEPEGDAAESVRALGKGLYRHPAVRSFVEGRGLGDLGVSLTTDQRAAIEDGLRRRNSADQIAAALRKKADGPGVIEAVLAALRKQWPDSELDIVRQGAWTFDPKFPMGKVNAARRPVARNPKIVAGVEAALAIGAPIQPVTLIHTKVIDKPGYEPIDGWHRLLANEHAGNDTIAAYVGEGDADWTTKLIAFDDEIPTPPDSAGQAVATPKEKA